MTFDKTTWHHIPDDLSLHKAGILPSQLGPTVLFPSLLNHALTSALVLPVFLKSSCHHTGINSRTLWHNISCFTLQLSMHTHICLCICITYSKWLRWSRGRVLAFSTQVCGFKPCQSRRIFRAKKILSTPSFRGEVKPSVPCRRFAPCKTSLNLRGSRNLGKITTGYLSRPQFHLSLLGSLASLQTEAPGG